MSARNELRTWIVGRDTDADALIDAYAHELAEKVQDAMEEVRAADWGRSSRSKRPYLQGMERALRALTKETADGE